jgi:IS30 family transposase
VEAMKLTVSEYAKRLNVSVQTVYKKVKRGVITTVKENNITYVLVDEEEGLNPVKQKVKNSSSKLLTLVKTQQKEIKRLTKQLAKCNKKSEKVYLSYIAELKHLQLKAPVNIDEDIIDVKKKKKKSKKKRKKDKK